MTQADEITAFVAEHCAAAREAGKRPGVPISTVAERFGLWQGEAAKALNELVAQGRLTAEGTRPIRFLPAPETASPPAAPPPDQEEAPPFSHMIGYNGSLEYQTQVASAAVTYPPHGIHTLIIGRTGVGKSLLASEMARYLSGIRGAPVPFVTFNCAEYADNPQLLLAQLFGYVKGAFTGAEKDKLGLVAVADGGILFLDELHRLPPTGQEMLFTLIDKGFYRRLGDNADHTAEIMIIGATTENPSNFLLNTFKRRIPLVVQIPELRERPINERLDLIARFLYQEALQLRRPIFVSYLALKLLVSFQGENNIGDLRNEIRVACAQSYWSCVRAGDTGGALTIDIYNLSRNLSIHYMTDEHVDAYFSAAGLDAGLTIPWDRPISFSPAAGDSLAPFDFPNFVEQKMSVYRGLGKDVSEAEHLVVTDLGNQYRQHGKDPRTGQTAPSDIVYGSIAPVVWQATNELIQYATVEFGKSYGQDVVNSIAYYLQQLKSYANAGRIIFSPSSFARISAFAKEKGFVVKMLPLLKNTLGIELMEGEIILLSMLLAHAAASRQQPTINLLLCGYAGCASDIAAFANNLMNTSFIKALDVPDNLDAAALRSRIFDVLGYNFHDTIILCGLSLASILERVLSKDSLLYVRILPALDPMFALECARMILMTDSTVDEIASELLGAYRGLLSAEFSEVHAAIRPAEPGDAAADDMRDVVITYCITGVGSARIIREMLLRDLTVASAIDVLPLGIQDDIFAISHKLGKRLKLIIGIMNPDIPGVPYLSMEQFLYSNSPADLLHSKGISLPASGEIPVEDMSSMPLDVQLGHIRENLYYFAPSLDLKKVEKGVRHIVDRVIQLYPMPLAPDLIVRVYIHCAAMFERIATADPIPMPLDGYSALELHRAMFDPLKEILNTGAGKLNLTVTDAEVYYLMITLPPLPEQ